MKTYLALCVSFLAFGSAVPASAQVLAAFAYDQAINNTGHLGETFTDVTSASATVNDITLAVSNYINFQDRNGQGGFPDDSGNITPFQGVVFSYGYSASSASMEFTLSGLTADTSYDVVVYSGDGGAGTGSEPTDVTLGGSMAELNAGTTSTTFIPAGQTGANYLEKIVTADSSGAIYFSAVADSAGDGYSFVDAVTVAAVPEPSTWLMMSVGLVGLLGLRRRLNRV